MSRARIGSRIISQAARNSHTKYRAKEDLVFPRRATRRSFSTSTVRRATVGESTSTVGSRALNFLRGSVLLLGFGLAYVYVTDTRAGFHRWVVIPAFRLIYPNPEEAHEAGNRVLKQLYTFGLYPRERGDPDRQADLAVEVFGTTLRNPVGVSAGIDKHAEITDPLFELGPSIIELGGTTPQPQPGNDKPRVFRLSNQNALINRYGLNSEGADHVAVQLRQRVRRFARSLGLGYDVNAEIAVLDGAANVPPGSLRPGRLLAVNIAKNKSTPETDIDAVTDDYVYCAGRLAPYVDILVVNVSSPNTPGLRSLQTQESLTKILSAVVKAAQSVQRKTKPAVMVKVSPDEDSDDQVMGICQAVWDSDVDGIIVGNTTNTRPAQLEHLSKLSSTEEQHLLEQGGFSGPHLFEKTKAMVQKYKKFLGDAPPVSTNAGPASSAAEKPTVDVSGPQAQATQSSEDEIVNSINTESIPFHNPSAQKESEMQPLIKLPTQRFYEQSKDEQDALKESPLTPIGAGPQSGQAPSLSSQQPSLKKEIVRRDAPKVIFATGGITNGSQALEVLNAGASIAMMYTAIVYGGVGTISRVKDEMRRELSTTSAARKSSRKVEA